MKKSMIETRIFHKNSEDLAKVEKKKMHLKYSWINEYEGKNPKRKSRKGNVKSIKVKCDVLGEKKKVGIYGHKCNNSYIGTWIRWA